MRSPPLSGAEGLTRRSLLRAALAYIAATSSLASAGCGDGHERADHPSSPQSALASFDRQATVRAYFGAGALTGANAVGSRYLARMAAVGRGTGIEPVASAVEIIAATASDDEALLALEEAIRSDFDALRVETEGGWVFSQVELQLCGLWALLTSGESEATS